MARACIGRIEGEEVVIGKAIILSDNPLQNEGTPWQKILGKV
jgi:hypothetical protein